MVFSSLSGKPKLGSQKEDRTPKPEPLPQEQEEDEYQDKLRNMKNYEHKKKQEQEQKKIQQRRAERQERGDTGPKKYTYDYDGRVLASRNVKVDRLQPTNFQINHQINDLSQKPVDEKAKKKPKQTQQEMLDSLVPK